MGSISSWFGSVLSFGSDSDRSRFGSIFRFRFGLISWFSSCSDRSLGSVPVRIDLFPVQFFDTAMISDQFLNNFIFLAYRSGQKVEEGKISSRHHFFWRIEVKRRKVGHVCQNIERFRNRVRRLYLYFYIICM